MENFIDDIIKKDLEEGKIKKVITRFPPEPNGYLHIGHAKSICLNYGLAVKYGGECNLRFDDTNPSTEDIEYVNSIIEDVKWLGWKGKIFYASDYFDQMYECALRLIKKGLAYVDDLSPEQMRQMRGTLTEAGIESKNRNRPIEESLRLFDDMKKGLVADGELILRAKIDMKSPNINMRDPILYRVVKADHHRQGDKWKIYPMYDFAHPIEDAVEKITHSICTLEFEDHRPLYDWIIENGGFDPRPHQYEFARLNITRTIMSKRYLKKLVDEGVVEGWDDPRMPTISGFRRRGYTPTAIKDFCERIGVAKANSEVDKSLLEFCMREELNKTAQRAMVVLEPVKLTITNIPQNTYEQCQIETMPNSPQTRTVYFGKHLFIDREDFKINPPPKYHRLVKGGMVRLKGAYIIKCDDYTTDAEGNVCEIFASVIEGTKSGGQSDVKVKGVIHWLNCQDAIDVEVRNFDELLLEGEGSFNERINPNTLTLFQAKAEPYLSQVKPFCGIQFMRQGYYCRDHKIADRLVFNRTVSLKDSYKPQQ